MCQKRIHFHFLDAKKVKKPEKKPADDDDDDGDVVYSDVTVKPNKDANKGKNSKKTEEKKEDAEDDDDDDDDAVVYSSVTVKPKQEADKKAKNPPVAPKPVGTEKKVGKAGVIQQQHGKTGKGDNPPKAPKPKKQKKEKAKKDDGKKADEGAYVNVNTGSGEDNTDQNLYANVDKSANSETQKPPENVGPDGTIYADLSFARSAPAAVKQHEDGDDDDDDKVVYAAINFTKKMQS
ncbi:hypothetical protein LSAT2_014518 [Lamellibrachia satsuma]|nr:hypothetical protein LSAT2_014518 [Lamellibrachia satsuma]